MKHLNSIRPFFWLSIIVVLASCSKKIETTEINTESILLEKSIQTAEGVIQADIDALSMQSTVNCNGFSFLPDCADITSSGEDFPKDITIDFGQGCEGPNGHVRSGIVHIHISNPLQQIGSIRTVTFENFSIDNVGLAGNRITTNTGPTEEFQPTFTRDIDMTVSINGNVLSRLFNLGVLWVSGYETAICGDNTFLISGEGTCIRPNNTEIQRTILEPLLRTYTCPYYTQGIVEVETAMGVHTINYGDGECDNIAIITANGESWEITL
jgi:hypothetical protein